MNFLAFSATLACPHSSRQNEAGIIDAPMAAACANTSVHDRCVADRCRHRSKNAPHPG
jgi:hypothetical protein